MLLSVLDVFSTAREASQTLKYPLKARNNGPPPKSSDDTAVQVSSAAGREQACAATAPAQVLALIPQNALE